MSNENAKLIAEARERADAVLRLWMAGDAHDSAVETHALADMLEESDRVGKTLTETIARMGAEGEELRAERDEARAALALALEALRVISDGDGRPHWTPLIAKEVAAILADPTGTEAHAQVAALVEAAGEALDEYMRAEGIKVATLDELRAALAPWGKP